nr:NAD(P)/FAD-dependent oxidoreductase [Clostridia bacterium]
MDGGRRRIVIIGSGIAGVSAAQGARRQDPEADVTLIGSEPRDPYFRLKLCDVVSARATDEKLALHPSDWYDGLRITRRTGIAVTAIRTAERLVELSDGSSLPYDALVLATGSVSFLPPVEGAGRPGVHTLWTLEDAHALRDGVAESCREGTAAVVVGGGLLGLEAAYNIAQAGCGTTVLEILPRLMARQLDARGAELLAARAESLGIRVRTGVRVTALAGGPVEGPDAPVQAVRLDDGTRIEAGVVLFSAGVRARIELAERAGIPTGRRIPTDARMRTGTPGIYAAGDCAEPEGYWSGQWAVARDQGLAAGVNAAGGDTVYT